MSNRIRIVKHEAVPGFGSFEVRFPDGRESVYSTGTISQAAGLGRKRWTVKPRWRGRRSLRGQSRILLRCAARSVCCITHNCSVHWAIPSINLCKLDSFFGHSYAYQIPQFSCVGFGWDLARRRPLGAIAERSRSQALRRCPTLSRRIRSRIRVAIFLQ